MHYRKLLPIVYLANFSGAVLPSKPRLILIASLTLALCAQANPLLNGNGELIEPLPAPKACCFSNPDNNPAQFVMQGSTTALMNGVIDSSTPARVRALIENNPDLEVIVLQNVPGSDNDSANLQAARMVREAGLNTHVDAGALVASGGVDFFLAGNTRTIDPAYCGIEVHEWGNYTAAAFPTGHPAHNLYLDYYADMGISADFYWFTMASVIYGGDACNFGTHNMSEASIALYGLRKTVEPVEIAVNYQGTDIADGDTTPSTDEGTDFGSVDFTSGSVLRSFQVENTGGSTLTLGSASSDNPDFIVSGLASSIEPDESDTFTIKFDPDGPGKTDAVISFSTNDADENPFNFTVSGEGLIPGDDYGDTVETAEPVDLNSTTSGFLTGRDFDYFQVSVTVPGTLEVYATGETDTYGELYSTEGLVAFNENDGEGLNFRISYPITTPGTYYVGVIIEGGGTPSSFDGYDFVSSFIPNRPEIAVDFEGTDIPDGANTPSTEAGTDFGEVDLSSGGVIRTFTVQNTGDALLLLEGLSSNDSNFTASGLPVSIEPGASDTFTVGFEPDSVGTKTATISFGTNDEDENPFSFAVTGVGTDDSASANWLDDADDIGDGWFYFDWFKGFKPSGENWIYHGRHGWLYVIAEDTSDMFLWDDAVGRWLYTNETVYPWMYAYGTGGGWVFFFEGGSPGSRFFGRGDNGTIISEQQLRLVP